MLVPFQQHFVMTVLAWYDNVWEARAGEREAIAEFETRGERGYNDLPGHAGDSRRVHAWLTVKKQQQYLTKQKQLQKGC